MLRSDIHSALEPLTSLSVRQVLVRRKLAHPLLLLLAAAMRPSLMSVTDTLRDFRTGVLELQGATAQLQKKKSNCTAQFRSTLTNLKTGGGWGGDMCKHTALFLTLSNRLVQQLYPEMVLA